MNEFVPSHILLRLHTLSQSKLQWYKETAIFSNFSFLRIWRSKKNQKYVFLMYFLFFLNFQENRKVFETYVFVFEWIYFLHFHHIIFMSQIVFWIWIFKKLKWKIDVKYFFSRKIKCETFLFSERQMKKNYFPNQSKIHNSKLVCHPCSRVPKKCI
jgi:hypothetical protein